MNRGVLSISMMTYDKKRFPTCFIEEAFGKQGGTGDTFPIQCTSADLEFANPTGVPAANSKRVQQAGRKLYDALVANKDVEIFFAQTDALPPSANETPSVYPLFLRMANPEAENFPWEILWENQKTFMILDEYGRWPIARLANMEKREDILHKKIGTGLRFAVVLAAAGEKGADEWQNISSSFPKLSAPLDVLALVSEDTAHAAILNDAASSQGANPPRSIDVNYVGNRDSFIKKIKGYMPNIIHIFCHGAAVDRPELQLETRADRIAGNPQGSTRLKIDDLKSLGKLDWLWLVVLNCCQGAKTAPQLHSIARDLVYNGVPAVVAMRESVQVDDAHLFAEFFYPKLFEQLSSVFADRNTVPPPNEIVSPELLWVNAAHEARRKLGSTRDRSPEAWPEWTYPVIYIHRDKLHFHPAQPALTEAERLELRARLDLLRSLRDNFKLANDPEAEKERANSDLEIHQIEAKLEGA